MALPALSTTYSTRRNISFPDTSTDLNILRSYLWTIKESLINASTGGTIGSNARTAASIWTVQSSSNGTTTNSTDLWGTGSFTAGNLVFANHGSNHSWICLQNTSLGLYLVLDCQPSATTTQVLISVWRTADGITAGSLTSRPRPTVTALELNLSYNTEATNNYATMYPDSTATGSTHFLHATYAADGTFYILAGRNLLGYCTAGFALQRGVNSGAFPANNSDGYNNLLIFMGASTSSPGVPLATSGVGPTNSGGCAQLHPNGTRQNSATVTGLSTVSFGNSIFANTNHQQEFYNLEFDAVPVYCRVANSSGQVANRGAIRDWWQHANRSLLPAGTVNDPGGIISHVVFGDFFLPWNGTVPTF